MIALADQTGAPEQRASPRMAPARAQWALGKRKQARARAQEALAIWQDAGDDGSVARTREWLRSHGG